MEPIFALLHVVMTVIIFSRANEGACRLQGDPVDPQLCKDGDIIVGGIFPFHSSWDIKELSYMSIPPPLKCMR